MDNIKLEGVKAFVIFTLFVNTVGLLLNLLYAIGVVFNKVEVVAYPTTFDIILKATRIVILPTIHVYFIVNFSMKYMRIKKKERK